MATGKWNTMASAAPGAIGVAVDRSSQWRLIVQAAAITDTNVSGATQPVWADVTGSLIDVSWQRGDPAAESRGPVGSANFRFEASGFISALGAGDPMALVVAVNDRLGAGCLIRFGYRRNSDSAWRPLFTGFIDTIDEDWSADQPRRVFDVQAFDTYWFIAGHRSPATYGTIGMTTVDAFTGLLSAIDWPFNTNYATAGPVLGGESAQAPLTLLHRVADSAARLTWALTDGRAHMQGWSDRAIISPRWHVVDAYSYVDAAAPYAFPTWAQTIIATRMRWSNSMDRMIYRASATSTKVAGTAVGLAISPSLSVRYRQRNDRPGWPKTDLLNSTYAASGSGQEAVDAVAERNQDPTRCDFVTFDTQTAPGLQLGSQKDLDTLLDFITANSELSFSYQVQRRTLGTAGWFNQLCTVGGIDGVITRDANQHRLIVTHSLNWWPE